MTLYMLAPKAGSAQCCVQRQLCGRAGSGEMSSTVLAACAIGVLMHKVAHLVLAQLEHDVHVLADALGGVELLQKQWPW